MPSGGGILPSEVDMTLLGDSILHSQGVLVLSFIVKCFSLSFLFNVFFSYGRF